MRNIYVDEYPIQDILKQEDKQGSLSGPNPQLTSIFGLAFLWSQ